MSISTYKRWMKEAYLYEADDDEKGKHDSGDTWKTASGKYAGKYKFKVDYFDNPEDAKDYAKHGSSGMSDDDKEKPDEPKAEPKTTAISTTGGLGGDDDYDPADDPFQHGPGGPRSHMANQPDPDYKPKQKYGVNAEPKKTKNIDWDKIEMDARQATQHLSGQAKIDAMNKHMDAASGEEPSGEPEAEPSGEEPSGLGSDEKEGLNKRVRDAFNKEQSDEEFASDLETMSDAEFKEAQRLAQLDSQWDMERQMYDDPRSTSYMGGAPSQDQLDQHAAQSKAISSEKKRREGGEEEPSGGPTSSFGSEWGDDPQASPASQRGYSRPKRRESIKVINGKKYRAIKESVDKRISVKEVHKWLKGLEEYRYRKIPNVDARRITSFVNNGLNETDLPKSLQKKWGNAKYNKEKSLADRFIKQRISQKLTQTESKHPLKEQYDRLFTNRTVL